ncbi:hypothetical protein [Vitiosangium sp. GDMCC 1.1324]|uniref:hypothetical protein n=1 Tax=Vitiosangium sp. (strain GDMCC 1.1324) TaxID=2138576 RepID=UPI000D390391|nr:hypothetical protein [Vitiosangium sp. GDMCC 1.1324]PTL79957.1 hypothetical protein DAT35_31545 [Vitiosangium sp. GDMCC 1.1324]
MKSQWLSAAVLAVAVAMSACGGTQAEPETTPEQGNVEGLYPRCDANGNCGPGFTCINGVCRPGVIELLPQCDEEGNCPTGYYCPGGPGSTCRRGGVSAQLPQCDEDGNCPVGFVCRNGPGSTCYRGVAVAQ